jgi:glucose-6-phosphate isomerase
MTNKEMWQRFKKHLRIYPQVGMKLDISRMRFPEHYIAQMTPAIERAFEAMSELEKGSIANPDEKRQVGHYWLRAPHLAPTEDLRLAILSSQIAIKEFAAEVHAGDVKPEHHDRFKNVVLLGIGGSALGPQLVADALWDVNAPMQLYFCDNTDPDGIARLLTQLGDRLDETLLLVVSKSGGTPETRNAALEFAEALADRGLSFAKHAVAVSMRDSRLDRQAAEQGWIRRFEMWDWVGGRTSLFSSVGLLPAALQGVPIDEMLIGAQKMDEVTRVNVIDENPAALLALMWYVAGDGRGRKDMVVLPYKDRLVLFSKYLQQLIMESLGKERDLSGSIVNQGIAVYGNKGSTDQHAYVQQLRDGLNNFFVTFVEVLADYTPGIIQGGYVPVEPEITSGDYLQGFLRGTRRALYENGRDSITLTLNDLSPQTLGALIALYERAVGLYASLTNINAYHQPGVEAGKKAASSVIALQQKLLNELRNNPGRAYTATELSTAIGAEEDVENVYHILEHLQANAERGLRREGNGDPESSLYSLV